MGKDHKIGPQAACRALGACFYSRGRLPVYAWRNWPGQGECGPKSHRLPALKLSTASEDPGQWQNVQNTEV